jgi:very-short-patch-repair endonuclease
VDQALLAGAIVRMGHGRYGLTALDTAVATAHGMRAVLSHTSAALWHGWEVKAVPALPHVIVPRHRKVLPERRARVHLHRAGLLPEEITDGICTSPETTLAHCLRTLPFDAALTVADSALRHGLDPAVLRRIARSVRGPGSAAVRRVVREARGEAANPFESVLRAIAGDVPGLRVRPQMTIAGHRQTVRPDLVDEDLRVVLEADSFEWPGGRAQLARDARRYNFLVTDGWTVLRFAWEDVMFDPGYVREVLVGVVGLVDARTQGCVCATLKA